MMKSLEGSSAPGASWTYTHHLVKAESFFWKADELL